MHLVDFCARYEQMQSVNEELPSPASDETAASKQLVINYWQACLTSSHNIPITQHSNLIADSEPVEQSAPKNDVDNLYKQ